MAISVIQRANNKAIGTGPLTVTLGAAPTDGNFLAIVISTFLADANAVTSIAQTGTTWVKATNVEYTGPNNAAGGTVDIWYAENVSSAGTSIVITFSSAVSASRIAEAVEVNGPRLSGTLDKTQTSTTDQGISDGWHTGTTATLSQASEFAVGGIWINSTNSATVSGGTLSLITSIMNTVDELHYMENITAATTAQSGGVVLSPTPLGYSSCGAIATFKAPATASASTLPLIGCG